MTDLPRFIAFEGIDFSGKTTQIARLSRLLTEKGIAHISTREPGGTESGRQIRQMILSDTQRLGNLAEFFLFLADRAEHVSGLIKPSIAAGKVVLCDRFVASTLVYQGVLRGFGVEKIMALHEDFFGNFWPDLTFVLDVSPEEAMARKMQDSLRLNNYYDNLEFERVARLREAFIDVVKIGNDTGRFRCEIINTSSGEDAVFAWVKRILSMQ